MSRNLMIATLAEMHTYARPHGTKADHEFRKRYLLNLPGARVDAHANIIVRVDDAPILWSAHTDTVSGFSGRQRVHLDARGTLSLVPSKRRGVLGADDTAGCFVLREMIKRGVPGTYVFHYGEERGGIGSRALSRTDPDWLRQFQCAIALDRKGTGDVITHQFGTRTASNAFALSLADVLNASPLAFYRPHDGGIYTDTAEYMDLIPECTNISIGYERAHSANETLDTAHVLHVLDALSETTIDKLTIARDPLAWESDARTFEEEERAEERERESMIFGGLDWRGFFEEPAHVRTDARGIYLDSTYADVQDALQRAQAETRARVSGERSTRATRPGKRSRWHRAKKGAR